MNTIFAENVILILSVLIRGAVSSFNCYSCTYTITVPPVNFECANEPWNFTIGQPVIPCDNTRHCITKTVYYPDKSKIKSMRRSCGTPETFQCGSNCCQGSIYDYTCQYQCQDNLCNDSDETRRTQDDNNVGGGAVHLLPVKIYLLICMLCSAFIGQLVQ